MGFAVHAGILLLVLFPDLSFGQSCSSEDFGIQYNGNTVFQVLQANSTCLCPNYVASVSLSANRANVTSLNVVGPTSFNTIAGFTSLNDATFSVSSWAATPRTNLNGYIVNDPSASTKGALMIVGTNTDGGSPSAAAPRTIQLLDNVHVPGGMVFASDRSLFSTGLSLGTPASPLTPSVLPPSVPGVGLLMRLDATDLVPLGNGAGVASWGVNSLGLPVAAQAISANQPVLSLSPQPFVSFDGVSDFMQMPAGFGNTWAGLSFIGVFRLRGPIGYYTRIFDFANGAPGQNILLGRLGSTNQAVYEVIPANQVIGGPLPSEEWFVLAVNHQANGNVQIMIDNAVVGTGSAIALPTVVSRSSNLIGRSQWYPGDGLQATDMAEQMLWNRELTATEWGTVNQYIANKWTKLLGPSVSLTTTGDAVIGGSLSAKGGATVSGRTTLGSGAVVGSINTPVAPTLPQLQLLFRLDAQTLTSQAAGSRVSAWGTTTGGLPQATQPSTNQQPLLTLSPAPYVTCDGVDDFLQFPAGFANGWSGLAFVAVVRVRAPLGTWARFIDFGNGAGNQNIFVARSGTTSNLAYQALPAVVVPSSITFPVDQWFVLAVNHQANGNVQIMINNAVVGSLGGIAVPPTISRSTNYVCRSNWADGFQPTDIAEMMLFSRELPTAEWTSTYQYLTTKWSALLSPSVSLSTTGDMAITGSILNAWQVYRAQIPAWSTSVALNNVFQNVAGCTVTFQCTKNCLVLMQASGHTSTAPGGGSGCWLYVSFTIDDMVPIPGTPTWPAGTSTTACCDNRFFGVHLASGLISGASAWQPLDLHQQMSVGPGIHTVWLRTWPQQTSPCPLNSPYYLNGVAMVVSVLNL